MKIYDFTVLDKTLTPIPLSMYKGKVLIIVNVASKCGLTPQYTELEALYKKYQSQGLEILGFPCNQFAGQEPGTNEEIATFCQLNYGVTFKIFDKIRVNGQDANPLFSYLTSEKKGLFGGVISWNFTKFLIGRDGQVLKRVAPKDAPLSMEDAIIAALSLTQ
ncbi:glutathione peroxidase [Erysipelotrichaceae bacterium]|nr:glutathione peroxidase [Erysipelotrichaceae bacterium]